MPRYPDYKDSGVEWLGEIPAHWVVRRAKFVFQRMTRPVRDEDEVVTAFRNGEVTLRSNRRTDGFTFSEKEIGYQGVRAGDLVIHEMDGFAGAIGVSDSDGKCSPIYSVCAPEVPADTKFFAYVLRHMAASEYLLALARGIRERSTDFRFKVFGDEEIPLLEIAEQRSIAAFLDRETARIDALVAKKERLIELLQQKRTALISRAVTKGLDPNVPMKDSGVGWLGEVPAHWEVRRLKTCADFINGAAFEPAEWGWEGTPIIRIQNLNGGGHFNFTTRPMPTKYNVHKGDILFGWSGNRGTSFGPFVWGLEGKYYLNQHIFKIVNYSARPDWFYWALRAVTLEIERRAHGIIGMVHVTRPELGASSIPFPGEAEQGAIAAFLDCETAKIDALVAKVREGIERLKEYRTALISAAVTGKIDVRQAPIPEAG